MTPLKNVLDVTEPTKREVREAIDTIEGQRFDSADALILLDNFVTTHFKLKEAHKDCLPVSDKERITELEEIAKDLDGWWQAGGTPDELTAVLQDICVRNHEALKKGG